MIGNLLLAVAIAGVSAFGLSQKEPKQLGSPGEKACVVAYDFFDNKCQSWLIPNYATFDVDSSSTEKNVYFTDDSVNVNMDTAPDTYYSGLYLSGAYFVPSGGIGSNVGSLVFDFYYDLFPYQVLNVDRNAYITLNALDFYIVYANSTWNNVTISFVDKFTFDGVGASNNILTHFPYRSSVDDVNINNVNNATISGQIMISFNNVSSSANPQFTMGLMTYANYGLDEDYSQGYDRGYATGFNDGYIDGNANGYRNGYAEGLSFATSPSANVYNLFGVVADTPIKFLRDMFNFELFGMNVAIIILSCLTAVVVFGIIKRVWK